MAYLGQIWFNVLTRRALVDMLNPKVPPAGDVARESRKLIPLQNPFKPHLTKLAYPRQNVDIVLIITQYNQILPKKQAYSGDFTLFINAQFQDELQIKCERLHKNI